MPQITKMFQNELQAHYENGDITDANLLRGLKDAFTKLDGQLNSPWGTRDAIHTYEVIIEEVKSQSGVRIKPHVATKLVSEYTHRVDALKRELR